MKLYKADLHIHTSLSPCGDLEMSPAAIIKEAYAKGLDIIGVSDHNTTRHARSMTELGREKGIYVLPGVEINTREEIHCLAFFENPDFTGKFQEYLDLYLPDIKNDPVRWGYQVELDRAENIIYEEHKMLYNGIDQSLEEVEQKVHELAGLFIPAHVDRQKNSLLSQLGFIPDGIRADAIEISRRSDPAEFLSAYPEFTKYQAITSSDAHYLADIGAVHTLIRMKALDFSEIRKAFRKLNGRYVTPG